MISIKQVELCLNQIAFAKQKLEEIEAEIPKLYNCMTQEDFNWIKHEQSWMQLQSWSLERRMLENILQECTKLIKQAQFERAYPMVGYQNIYRWQNLYDK